MIKNMIILKRSYDKNMIILELGNDKKMIYFLKQMMFFDNFEEAKMIKKR